MAASNKSPYSIAGETALVTGASRGIGHAIALRLGQLGAKIVGTATSVAGAQAITESFAKKALPTGSCGCILDLGKQDDSALQPLQQTLTKTGMPSILINNAGITRDSLLLRMQDQAWREVLEVNLGGTFRISKLCLKAMYKARRGRIINISSLVGFSGNAGQANYVAAKAGVTAFTKVLAREAAPRGITVNAVAPGLIRTDMTASISGEKEQDILARIPLGRWGEADEIAEVVAFMVSPAAAYITGETIHVNGGLYMA